MNRRWKPGTILAVLLAVAVWPWTIQAQSESESALIPKVFFTNPPIWRMTKDFTNTAWGKDLFGYPRAAGRGWHAANMNAPLFGINDLSHGDLGTLTFGGYFFPHSSHQNGLDVDVRYVRSDGDTGMPNIALNPEDYDTAATSTLMNRFILNGRVEKILVDMDNIGFTGPLLRHEGGHSDHFHIRIIDPDGTENKKGGKTMRGNTDENQTNR